VLILLAKQHRRCALCQGLLLHVNHEPRSPTEWERWHRITRNAITKQSPYCDAILAAPKPGREPLIRCTILGMCARTGVDLLLRSVAS
jgi:hypothetical protein